MLEKILEGNGIEDTIEALEWRQREGTKWNKMKPNFFEKMIGRLKDEKVNWEAKEIRKNMIDNYNKIFW